MKVTALSLTAPKAAANNPALTPELLASVLARYSRSNEGITSILAKVDLSDPESSIERILKFVDYGHASIGGMAAGLAVAIDGISMYAAYRLFELSPMADGQESSTRYINIDKTGLPDWSAYGFNAQEADDLHRWATASLDLYQFGFDHLSSDAERDPSIVRIPEKLVAKPGAVNRLRKNYALDRTRYFLPFALKTNVGLVQSARMWTETITALMSSRTPELELLGESLLKALAPYAPNLLRYARVKPGWVHHAAIEAGHCNYDGVDAMTEFADRVKVSLFTEHSDVVLAAELIGRANRYDRCGAKVRDTSIRCAWSGMAVAELRDLNRHRTGSRFSPLIHRGFYLPPETRKVFSSQSKRAQFSCWSALSRQVLEIGSRHPELRPYTLSLGSQVDFRHTTQLNQFVYTAELRTGAGAHFRYAKHYGNAVDELKSIGYPRLAAAIATGEAEPE